MGLNWGRHREMEKFIDESRANQRNIVFPDTVRNARSVDAFLWRGSPHPPLVQRIVAWMFGLFNIGIGLLFLLIAGGVRDRYHSWIGSVLTTLVAFFVAWVGIRIFRNGFPRRSKPAQHSD